MATLYLFEELQLLTSTITLPDCYYTGYWRRYHHRSFQEFFCSVVSSNMRSSVPPSLPSIFYYYGHRHVGPSFNVRRHRRTIMFDAGHSAAIVASASTALAGGHGCSSSSLHGLAVVTSDQRNKNFVPTSTASVFFYAHPRACIIVDVRRGRPVNEPVEQRQRDVVFTPYCPGAPAQ